MQRMSAFLAILIGVLAGTAKAQLLPAAMANQAVSVAEQRSAQSHEFRRMNSAIGLQHPLSASDVAKLNAVVQDGYREARGLEAILRGRAALDING